MVAVGLGLGGFRLRGFECGIPRNLIIIEASILGLRSKVEGSLQLPERVHFLNPTSSKATRPLSLKQLSFNPRV